MSLNSLVAVTNFKCGKYTDVNKCPRETCTNCTNHAEYVVKYIPVKDINPKCPVFKGDKYIGDMGDFLEALEPREPEFDFNMEYNKFSTNPEPLFTIKFKGEKNDI